MPRQVAQLLPSMTDVNGINSQGEFDTSMDTALIMTVKHGRNMIFETLLKEPRTDLDAQDVTGVTALMWAVRSKHVNMKQTQVSYSIRLWLGADTGVQDRYRGTIQVQCAWATAMPEILCSNTCGPLNLNVLHPSGVPRHSLCGSPTVLYVPLQYSVSPCSAQTADW